MKTFKKLISEIAQPKSPEERAFKDQHVVQKFDYPVKDSDAIFKGSVEKKKRPADYDAASDKAAYDKATPEKPPFKMPRNVDESVGLDEAVGTADYHRKKKEYHAKMSNQLQHKIDTHYDNGDDKKAERAERKQQGHENAADAHHDAHNEIKKYGREADRGTIDRAVKMSQKLKEEAEQIDEISKALAGRYIKKAQISTADAGRDTMDDDPNRRAKGINKIVNRRMGAKDAVNKLTGKARVPATESYDDSPASPDEASMAKKQAEFIQYVAREIGMHINNGKEFPEWMQNKLSALHQSAKDYHSHLGAHGPNEEVELDEVTQSAIKKPVTQTGPDGKTRTVMKSIKNTEYDDYGQEKIKTKKEAVTKKAIQRALQNVKAQPKDKVSVKKAPWEKNESLELDEISKTKMGQYIKRAHSDKDTQTKRAGIFDKKGMDADKDKDMYSAFSKADKARKKAANRTKFIGKAVDRITKESIDESVKAGNMKLRDGSSVKVSAQDAKLITQMMKDLNAANRRKMEKVMMTDKAGFEEILGFAREAL